MSEALLYNSRFLKADMRSPQSQDGCTSYTAVSDPGIDVRDIFMPPGSACSVSLVGNKQHIFLPIVGGIVVKGMAIDAGELYCCCNDSDILAIRNPYEQETINFLHISLNERIDQANSTIPVISSLPFTSRNSLTESTSSTHTIRAGVYDGRVSDVAKLSCKDNAVFVYVVNGSFEVQGRLMEYRDGLCLWQTDEVEFEALSEAAIILFIEYSPLK